MTSDVDKDSPCVRKIDRTDGDITFSYISVDGIGMIPFPGLMSEGPARRFQAIRDLETKSTDIMLATYPKSGMPYRYIKILKIVLNSNSKSIRSVTRNLIC